MEQDLISERTQIREQINQTYLNFRSNDSVKSLELAIKDASKHFITETPYTYAVEFVNRGINSGTRMPLTLYAYSGNVMVYRSASQKEYANYELKIEGKFVLTNLGKLKLAYMKEIDDREKREKKLERSTLGTIALWWLRKQERKRQLMGIKIRSQNEDWLNLRKNTLDRLNNAIKIYQWGLDEAIDFLEDIISDKSWNYILEGCLSYILEQRKKGISMVSPVYDRMRYEEISEFNFKESLPYYVEMIKLIRDNFYSEKRLNPQFILSAIRNRPLDLIDMDENSGKGTMDRSREALGQPPFSLFWMFLYYKKKEILHGMISKFQKLYNIDFIDPIRDESFYYKFTQNRDGLYLFGDNGMIIKNKERGIYDLSLSDVYQAWSRADGKKNFCFFVWLDGKEYSCGSTGDAFTTVWNIEGQLNLWDAFNKGLLSSQRNWPEVKDLAESTDGFLGCYYDSEREDWYNAGLKITMDSVKKAIPFSMKRGGYTTFKLEPRSKGRIKRNEILSLAIGSGVIDIGIKKFYEWVEKWNLATRLSEAALYSNTERLAEVIRTTPKFLELSEANLDDLAFPYKLVD